MGEKILFVKLGALGDLNYASPAPSFIKKHLPDSHLTWVVGKSSSPYLQKLEHIDRLIVVDDKKFFSKNLFQRLSELSHLIHEMDTTYDLILIAHRNIGYALYLRGFLHGKIFQLARKEPKFLQSFNVTPVVVPPLGAHETHAIRSLVASGITAISSPPDLNLWEYGGFTQNQNSDYVVFHAGGAGNTKTEFRLKSWNSWETLARKYLSATNLELVLVGSPSEYASAEELIKKLGPSMATRIQNKVGRTSIPELEHLIKGARAFVGIDSGPLHIADSLGIPSLGLYGPTSTISWGLLSPGSKALSENIGCSPCYKDDGKFPSCPNQHKCMTDLKPEKVFQELMQLLG